MKPGDRVRTKEPLRSRPKAGLYKVGSVIRVFGRNNASLVVVWDDEPRRFERFAHVDAVDLVTADGEIPTQFASAK